MTDDKDLPRVAEKNSPLQIPKENEEENAPSLLPHPNTPQAAEGMAAIAQHFARELTATDMLDVLHSAARMDSNGHNMMFTQAQVLDSLFHRLTLKAMSGVDKNGAPIKDYVENISLELALRTQKQCRTTLEALNILNRRKDLQTKNEPHPWKK